MTSHLRRPVTTFLLATMLLAAATVTPPAMAQTSDEGAFDNFEQRQVARRTLVDLLASDSMRRIGFEATSVPEALQLIGSTIDPFFNDAIRRQGSVEQARRQCEAVLQGFNDHSVRRSDSGRANAALVVVDGNDARLAGELFARMGQLLDRLRPLADGSTSSRRLARNAFSQVILDVTSAKPPIAQYIDKMMELSEMSDEDLRRYVIEP